MSVAHLSPVRVKYRWCFPVIPWYRQLMATVFGVGVMLIALWAIEQGTGPILITSVAGMAFLTILLIFGIEIDELRVESIGLKIDFTNTGMTETRTVRRDEDDD